jgi:hypothetical protein
VFAVLAAPLVELATRRGQGNRNVRWLSAAHQSFSQKVGLAGQPDDPLHGPPIKRNLPATTDDTSNNESFHAALPKGHPSSSSWPHIGWGETSLLDFLSGPSFYGVRKSEISLNFRSPHLRTGSKSYRVLYSSQWVANTAKSAKSTRPSQLKSHR